MYTDTLSFLFSVPQLCGLWYEPVRIWEESEEKLLKGTLLKYSQKKYLGHNVNSSFASTQTEAYRFKGYFHWNGYLKLLPKIHRYTKSLTCEQRCVNIKAEITEQWQPPDQCSCWYLVRYMSTIWCLREFFISYSWLLIRSLRSLNWSNFWG